METTTVVAPCSLDRVAGTIRSAWAARLNTGTPTGTSTPSPSTRSATTGVPPGSPAGRSDRAGATTRLVGKPSRGPRGCSGRRQGSRRPNSDRRTPACPCVRRQPPPPGLLNRGTVERPPVGTVHDLPIHRGHGTTHRTWPRPRAPQPGSGRPSRNPPRARPEAIRRRRLRQAGLQWQAEGGDAWSPGRY